MEAYKGKKRHELPPHVYAVADSAYRRMLLGKIHFSFLGSNLLHFISVSDIPIHPLRVMQRSYTMHITGIAICRYHQIKVSGRYHQIKVSSRYHPIQLLGRSGRYHQIKVSGLYYQMKVSDRYHQIQLLGGSGRYHQIKVSGRYYQMKVSD